MNLVDVVFILVLMAAILIGVWHGGQAAIMGKIKKSGLLSPDHAQSLLRELAANLQECHKASIDFQQAKLNPHAADQPEEHARLQMDICIATKEFWDTANLTTQLGLIQQPKSYKIFLKKDLEAGR
jgi:hypothetical protein